MSDINIETPEIDSPALDEINQAFAEHIGETEGTEVEGQSPTEPIAPEDDKFTINGAEYTEQELVDLAQLQSYITTNPDFHQHIQTFFQQGAPPPGPPQTQLPAQQVPSAPAPVQQPTQGTLPDYIKPEWLSDPIIKPLIDYTQSVQAQVAQQQQILTQFQAAQEQERRTRFVAVANNAAATFQQKMTLTPEEMLRVRNVASQMGIVERLMTGVDPTTGLPANPDFNSAAEKAYEIAYYSMPDMRARTVTEQVKETQEKRVKRAKASSVSGSAGSAARTPPPPNKSQSLRDQLQAEVDRIYAEKGA